MESSHISSLNKGDWTAEEDKRLAEYVGVHGPNSWKSVAIKSGLKRCGKSCRLRWLNYLRPDIKRGCISHLEDDLILRFHRLLGNRWSLIAKRLPGRTDNEIKNYWNAHLRKKANLMDKLPATALSLSLSTTKQHNHIWNHEESSTSTGTKINIADTQGQCGLDWVKTFLQLDQEHVSN